MEYKQTLQRRIIVAFFLLTLVLCGGFAAVNYFVVHELETELFYDHLQQDAEWLISAYRKGYTVTLPDGITLYRVRNNDLHELPDYLRELTADQAEIVLSDKAYHVIVRHEGDTRYYLVQDQSRFEETEKAFAVGILLAFIGALLGALWLGFGTANRVIAPVIGLARQVRNISSGESDYQALSNHFSEDEVGQLAFAFDQYTGKLQDFLDRERLFTGDVSHELRTPLMVITSSCELLIKKYNLDSNRQQIVARVYDAAQDMQLLVDAFLVLSRTSENASREMERFSINAIIKEEVDYPHRRSTSIGAVDIRMVENEALDAWGIPQLFRVVIRNLLRNALHNTEKGVVSVTIGQKAVQVEDTGLGVPGELRDSIFDRHVQISNDINPTQGQGLGLSIVKRICDYHQWQIRLEPGNTCGSRFTIDVSGSLK